jgi:hypothetical protein
MTVLLVVTSAKLSERLVRITHYLVFKDRLFAFDCFEQNLIIPNWRRMSTGKRSFLSGRVESFPPSRAATPRAAPTKARQLMAIAAAGSL